MVLVWAQLSSQSFMSTNSSSPYNNPIPRVLLLYPLDN